MKAEGGPRAYQQVALVLLRVVVGWHFLYEGYIKLMARHWSAQSYLADARGPLAEWFKQMAEAPRALQAVNLLNEWGLALIGACLMLGFATRLSCLGAMAMLALYYLSNPPWIGVLHRAGEGNYLYVDKNVIEFFAVAAVLMFNTGRVAGLDVLVHEWRRRRNRVRSEPDVDA